MRVTIQDKIAEKYPQYKMGLIRIKISSKDYDKLKLTLADADKKIIADKAKITKEWLDIFKDMNASERRLPSVVALWSVIDKVGELSPINYFVDAYNFISVKHGIPMGGYDISKLPDDDLNLRYAINGGLRFTPLGLNGQTEKIKDAAEICYYSGDTPVCRYWNNKDSDITKIYDNTNEVLIMFYHLGTDEELKNAMNEFINLINETSDVIELKQEVLNKDKTICDIL